ncbi:Sensor histidine kinase CpxA [invertebrate metagenome]|uniref:histidine kinase n=1 Tax=invertebrate metagenome TaxID=1711999 RepID=A0A2H9TB16_9ZZZZ
MSNKRFYVWPTHSVFWKIFLWFWLTIIILIATLIVSAALTSPATEYNIEQDELILELKKAAQKFQEQVISASKDEIAHDTESGFLHNSPNNEFFLFSSTGQLMSLNNYSPYILAAYRQLNHHTDPQIVLKKGVIMVGPQIVTVNNEPYQLYLVKRNAYTASQRIKHAIKRQWTFIFSALCTSFLLCLFLARSIIVPIREMQRYSKALAKGDFSVSVGTKITERKDEIGQLANDFENMTQQLESLIHSRDQLLRDVSHEFRSPLTRLQISLALARRKAPEAENEHARIEREAERLEILIRHVLSFYRIEHKAIHKTLCIIALDQLIKPLIEDGNFEALARDKSVRLVSCTKNAFIKGSREFMSSAIENIIRNAIRFAPVKTSVDVSLNIHHDDKKIIITVRDYGPGVPEEAIHSLFDPFFRVNETRGQENNGAGIGLAIAKRAVDYHNGNISVWNAHPGLSIAIELPLYEYS